MAETKNICGKIPADLHEKVRQEIEQEVITTSEFLRKVIEEHFMEEEGAVSMAVRTIAVQVSEKFFSRLKAVVAHKGCKQKDFLITVIERAIMEAEEEYERMKGVKALEDGATEEKDTMPLETPEVDAPADGAPVAPDAAGVGCGDTACAKDATEPQDADGPACEISETKEAGDTEGRATETSESEADESEGSADISGAGVDESPEPDAAGEKTEDEPTTDVEDDC